MNLITPACLHQPHISSGTNQCWFLKHSEYIIRYLSKHKCAWWVLDARREPCSDPAGQKWGRGGGFRLVSLKSESFGGFIPWGVSLELPAGLCPRDWPTWPIAGTLSALYVVYMGTLMLLSCSFCLLSRVVGCWRSTTTNTKTRCEPWMWSIVTALLWRSFRILTKSSGYKRMWELRASAEWIYAQSNLPSLVLTYCST